MTSHTRAPFVTGIYARSVWTTGHVGKSRTSCKYYVL